MGQRPDFKPCRKVVIIPSIEDFAPGGRHNRNGCLSPAKACERYYVVQRLCELDVLPVYSMPEGSDDA